MSVHAHSSSAHIHTRVLVCAYIDIRTHNNGSAYVSLLINLCGSPQCMERGSLGLPTFLSFVYCMQASERHEVLCPVKQYRFLRRVPFLSPVITYFLPASMVIQLFFYVLIFAFSVNHSANQHSCISSHKGLMFWSLFLCALTRALLPLIMVYTFSRAVISKLGTQASFLTSDFVDQISRKENEPVLQAVVDTFWDVGLAKKTILKTLTHDLAKELSIMCITSILQAAIITLMLIQVGATRFVLDAFSLSLSGVLERLIVSLEALSYFVLILTTGIIYSFYTHETTVNHLIAGAIALEDVNTFCVEPSKKLIMSAKNTVSNFDYSWRFAEVFIILSVHVYTLILVLFAAAGLPLSCDITAHIHAEQTHLHWITFVIVFTAGHFLSTFVWPSAHYCCVATVVRAFGILLQVLLLMALYIVQPPCLGYHLQILFAIIPAAFFFWHLWLKVLYENSVRVAKPKGRRQQHERDLAIYICLMAELVLAIVVSIYSEYSILSLN